MDIIIFTLKHAQDVKGKAKWLAANAIFAIHKRLSQVLKNLLYKSPQELQVTLTLDTQIWEMKEFVLYTDKFLELN